MRTEVKPNTDEFKLKVVHEYLNTDLSQREVLLKYVDGSVRNYFFIGDL
jgi:Trp operon repressor